MWKKGEWWGWHLMMEDWKDDLWMLKYLCSWSDTIPQQVKDAVDEKEIQ